MAYDRINSSIGFRPVYIPPSERFTSQRSILPSSRTSPNLPQAHRSIVLEEAQDTFRAANLTAAASPVIARQLMRSPHMSGLAAVAAGITTPPIFQSPSYEQERRSENRSSRLVRITTA